MPSNDKTPAGPTRKIVSYLSEKTLIPFGFVLTLVTCAVALTKEADGIDKRFDHQDHTNDQIVQRLADHSARMADFVTKDSLQSREAAWRAWVELLRAKLPRELQSCVPEAPK